VCGYAEKRARGKRHNNKALYSHCSGWFDVLHTTHGEACPTRQPLLDRQVRARSRRLALAVMGNVMVTAIFGVAAFGQPAVGRL
jgi:hypothetical protein